MTSKQSSVARPRRKGGGQPGNRNALKHGLYARLYPPETMDILLKWDVKDYIGEALLMRTAIDRVAEILLLEDVSVLEKVAMLNALTRAVRSVPALVSRHLLLNTYDDPLYKAWDDTTYEHEFFTDGVPPE